MTDYFMAETQTNDPLSSSLPSTGLSSPGPSATGQQPSSTDAVPPINTSGSSSSSLSAGASAGIGVGAGVGVLVLALLGWLLYLRRNKVRVLHKGTLSPTQEMRSTSTAYYQHGSSSHAVSKSPLHEAPSSHDQSLPAELEGR